jgi:hypothetical protein
MSDHTELPPRPLTPFPSDIMDLRTPSYNYNHGGYYAPEDPRKCNNPGGICECCQIRIDEEEDEEYRQLRKQVEREAEREYEHIHRREIEEAAAALLLLTPRCCADKRPEFLEPCPFCGEQYSYVSHISQGLRTCNGCEDKFCIKCRHGSRYCCAAFLPAPSHPLSRQCSEDKWAAAEGVLRHHPEQSVAIAEHIPNRHVYAVLRHINGELSCVHNSIERCPACDDVVIPAWERERRAMCLSCWHNSHASK